MSLETLCVKTESWEVCVKEEAEEECDNEESKARVKEGAECEDSVGLCKLYADHQVKDELVLGPVEIHRPCVASTLTVSVSRAEQAQALGRACSVKLSRLLVERSCRVAVGRHTDTRPSTREPRHSTDTEIDTYQCDHCAKLFTNKTVLRKHVHAHSTEPSTSFNKYALPATLKRVQESRGRARSVRRGLRGVAGRAQGGGKRFKCSHCDYECNWKSYFWRHQSMHTGENLFNCSHCDYKSVRKSRLVCHERIHTGEKPFECSYCDYKCRIKNSLINHERIHTGEKPFKCSHCDYMCRRQTDLVSHDRIHTGEKPFKCSQCDYMCRRKADLVNHERIHTGEKPFKCSHCDYMCRWKAALVRHERIHTGKKPLKCSHCDYMCRRKAALVRHERIHTGENPF